MERIERGFGHFILNGKIVMNNWMLALEVNNAIKERRLTMRDVEKLSGIDRRTIAKWLKGNESIKYTYIIDILNCLAKYDSELEMRK